VWVIVREAEYRDLLGEAEIYDEGDGEEHDRNPCLLPCEYL
jgi:hypothetical protein